VPSDPDRIANVRRLLKMAERVEKLERDVAEVLALMRALVVTEPLTRRLPEVPRRRRKPIRSL
jgi:hypothetical protein